MRPVPTPRPALPPRTSSPSSPPSAAGASRSTPSSCAGRPFAIPISSPAARCPPPRRRSRKPCPASAARPPIPAKRRPRSWPPPLPSSARSSDQSRRTRAACATVPCSWSRSPAPCAVRSSPLCASSTSRLGSAACGSPRRRPRARRLAPSSSPCPTATPSSARCAPSPPGRRPRHHHRPDVPPDLAPQEGPAVRAPSPAPPRHLADRAQGGRRHRQDARHGNRVRWGDFGGHSLKRDALSTGMDRGEHPA